MYDTEGLLSVLVLNLIVSPVLLLVASALQHKDRLGRALLWKVFRPCRPHDGPTFFNFKGFAERKSTYFGALMRGRDPWLRTTQALEAQMYLQFLRMLMLMLGTTSLLLLIVLIPVNVTSDYREEFADEQNDSSNPYEPGIADWTTRNIGPESSRMWAILAMSVVVALEIYGMSANMMNIFMRAKATDPPPLSAVVDLSIVKKPEAEVTVADIRATIPPQYRSSVRFIEIPRKSPEGMLETMTKHDEALKQLEHWYAFCEKNEITGEDRLTDKRVAVRPSCCGSKVNAIEHFRGKVDDYYERLVEFKKQSDADEGEPLGAAYVTFDSTVKCSRYVAAANSAALVGQPVRFAPHPKCIIWGNLGTSWIQLRLRYLVTAAALTALALVWGSIIAFLGSVDKLGEVIPAFEALLDTNEELRGLVTAYLPVIALAVLNMLLPKILRAWTEKFELAADRTEREQGVLRKYFIFSLFTSILLQAAAQGVGDSTDILEGMDTKALLYLLSSMIVPTNGFFAAFVMQAAFMGNCTRLIRVGDCILGPIKSSFALTQKELDAAYERPQFYFSEHYAYALVLFSFVCLFGVNVPYIPIFGFIFFLLRYLVDRATLADMYPRSRRSNLCVVPTAIMSVLVVLLLMQLFGVTLLSSIKERWDVFGVSMVPMVLTAMCIFWVYRKADYAMGPKFIVDALDGKAEPLSEAPTVTAIIGQFIDGRPLGQPYNLDFTAWLEADKVGKVEGEPVDDSQSPYLHPAKAYLPVKTDHEAMAENSFYVHPKEDPPQATKHICASDSVFFSHPSTPVDVELGNKDFSSGSNGGDDTKDKQDAEDPVMSS